MIRNDSKSRATKRNSAQELNKVDEGKHPSAKTKTGFRTTRHFRARIGFDPGVFLSGATPRRSLSAFRAACAGVVHRGNRPAVVPL